MRLRYDLTWCSTRHAAAATGSGLILNYVRRDQGDYVQDSHHRWMIRSFWWALIWLVIGFITSVIFIGWIVCFLAWAWYIYRHIRGLIALVNGEPLPR